MNTSRLQLELHRHRYWLERLVAEFPDADEATLRDTLHGLTSVPEMIASVLRSYLDDLTLAAALGMRISEMQGRLSRLEARADRKRAMVTLAMEEADLKRLSEADFIVSLRPMPLPLAIINEEEIPEKYWKPQPPKLDRQSLTAALRAGQSVPGASLGNARATISVRTN
jgi:hypothetical protein